MTLRMDENYTFEFCNEGWSNIRQYIIRLCSHVLNSICQHSFAAYYVLQYEYIRYVVIEFLMALTFHELATGDSFQT